MSFQVTHFLQTASPEHPGGVTGGHFFGRGEVSILVNVVGVKDGVMTEALRAKNN